MTINIALVTRESVILGCDSLSSASEWAFFPYREGAPYAKDADGNDLLDGEGNRLVAVPNQKFQRLATTVIGGAKKMFPIYVEGLTCVAAVTSGSATILGETIADMAKRFIRETKAAGTTYNQLEAVAIAFHDFARLRWEQEVEFAEVPDEMKQFLPTLQFLVGGIGEADDVGGVFRLDLKEGLCERQFDGSLYGVCWAGQAESAERLIRGVDSSTIWTINREIAKALENQREATLKGIGEALAAAGVVLPEGIELPVEEVVEPSIQWNSWSVPLDFANFSNQYAVEFVSLLVNTQSGIQRFANGIATVGGRTHIGIIEKGERLRMLNDPELLHAHTGYGDG